MAADEPLLSIVAPVHNEQPIIDVLVDRLIAAVQEIDGECEIILVEDGSRDCSWEKITENCHRYSHVKGVQLSRNFGQHNAIGAGLEIAQGQYVVVMDCDLQDNPDYIPQLLNKAREGYDIVYTRHEKRNHGFFKNLTARFYYRILGWISSFEIDPTLGRIGAYSLISRQVVDAYLRFNDYRKAYLMTLQWLGFHSTVIPVVHDRRYAGRSSYTFIKMVKHAVNYTVSYSDRLLYAAIYAGIFFSMVAFAGIVTVIYRYFTVGSLVGWPSLIVTMMFFAGLILTALGIMGVYIGKIFEQTKHRPRYLISKTVNF